MFINCHVFNLKISSTGTPATFKYKIQIPLWKICTENLSPSQKVPLPKTVFRGQSHGREWKREDPGAAWCPKLKGWFHV